MKGSVINRIANTYKETQASVVGYRGDLHLADYRPITSVTAQILVGYDPSLGAPSTADIKRFTNKLSSNVSAMIKTATLHVKEAAVAIVIFKQADARKFDDRDSMHEMIPDTQYVDMRTAEVWNVEEVEGKKVLVRKAEDDIEAILKGRKQKVKTASVSFSTIRTAGLRHMNAGDLVEFIHKDDIRKGVVHKIIRNASGDRVLVEREGEMHDVPIEAVTNVTISAENVEQERDELYEYYRKVYGDEYAKKLVFMD